MLETTPANSPPPAPFAGFSTRAPDAKSYVAVQKSHDSTTFGFCESEDDDGGCSVTFALVSGILQLGQAESKQYVLPPCRTTATAPVGLVAGLVRDGSCVSRSATLSISVGSADVDAGRARQFTLLDPPLVAELPPVPSDPIRSRSRRIPRFLAKKRAEVEAAVPRRVEGVWNRLLITFSDT
jgi:hypothetical protein